MIKTTTCLAVLMLSCGSAQASLLTNFAASFGKLQPCAGAGHTTSKCFKLYCDPQGIVGGRMTAFIDVPDLRRDSRSMPSENSSCTRRTTVSWKARTTSWN